MLTEDEDVLLVREGRAVRLYFDPSARLEMVDLGQGSTTSSSAARTAELVDDLTSAHDLTPKPEPRRVGDAWSWRFEQTAPGGLRIKDAGLAITTTEAGRIRAIYNGLETKDCSPPAERSFVSSEEAIEIAGGHVGAPSWVARPPTEAAVATDDRFARVWEVVLGVEPKARDGSRGEPDLIEYLVDASSGELLDHQSLLLRAPAPVGSVYEPDPTTDPDVHEVPLQRLAKPSTGEAYRLSGRACVIDDWAAPTSRPPREKDGDFRYDPKRASADFRAVMAYYWITLGHQELSRLGVDVAQPIVVDPGAGGPPLGTTAEPITNSFFIPVHKPSRGPAIALGGGAVPGAYDAAVILHEYGHAIQHFQNFAGRGQDLREGWADVFACLMLDRHRYHSNPAWRARVFRTLQDRRGGKRGLWRAADYTRRGRSPHMEGRKWASLVWRIFLNIGGNSPDSRKRDWARDVILKLHLCANRLYMASVGGPYSTHQAMAMAMLDAGETDLGIPGTTKGQFRAKMLRVFRQRRLLPGS